MPAKKTKRVSKNKKGGADTTDDSSKISSIKNFTSTRSVSPVNLSGSMPKSSEGFKAPSSSTTSGSLFSSSPNKSRLMSMPVSAAAASAAAMSSSQGNGVKIFKYIIAFFILAFLFLTLYLYLEKPETTDITHLYDPVVNFFVNSEKKKPESGVNKLAKTLDEKKVVNNIDNAGAGATGTSATDATSDPILKEKKYKKKPIIPQADDSTSLTQMKPKSKAGFCYIGEDRGFRSCIEVGEGDVCMSGDIFPTRAICINPNLRE
jgi:hypothetical protein